MITIPYEDRQDFIKFLTEQQNSGKIIGKTGMMGRTHKGHGHLFRKVKELCDISVIFYAQWMIDAVRKMKNFQYEHRSKDLISFDDVILSIKNDYENIEQYIDYLVFSPMTPPILKDVNHFLTLEDYVYTYCDSLQVPFLSPLVLFQPIRDPDFLNFNNDYCGPKNILLDLIARKILNSGDSYKCKYIWSFYRDPKTFHTESRTSSSMELGSIIKEVHNSLISKTFSIEKIKNKFSYQKNLQITIVDLNTLKLLDKPSEFCNIICSTGMRADFLYIKDNEIIF